MSPALATAFIREHPPVLQQVYIDRFSLSVSAQGKARFVAHGLRAVRCCETPQ